MGINCCKDCDKREVGCHSVCEKYISEKNEFNRIRELENKQNDTARALRRIAREGCERMKNRKKSGVWNGKK